LALQISVTCRIEENWRYLLWLQLYAVSQEGADSKANGHRAKERLKAKELKYDLKYGCETSTFLSNILPLRSVEL